MRALGQALLVCLAALCLASALPGCSLDDLVGDESSANPSPDDITGAALTPKPPSIGEATGVGVHCPGSFRTFKKVVKKSSLDPGDGREWHHIVNQNSTNRKNFRSRLHCTDNLISLPKAIHHEVTAHYNRKHKWTKGDFVRDVINKRTWREQYEYGVRVLRDNAVTL